MGRMRVWLGRVFFYLTFLAAACLGLFFWFVLSFGSKYIFSAAAVADLGWSTRWLAWIRSSSWVGGVVVVAGGGVYL